MKTNTKNLSSGKNSSSNESISFIKKLGLGVAILGLGSSAAFYTLQDGAGLSKFNNDLNVTPENAGSTWKTSGDANPYRAKLSASYAAQLDVLTVAVLNKGKNLSFTAFTAYLKNLSTGITALGKQPAYAGNSDIQNIIGYLVYEIDDTVVALEKTDFLKKMSDVITGTGTVSDGTGTGASTLPKIQSFSGSIYPTGIIGTCEMGPNKLSPCNGSAELRWTLSEVTSCTLSGEGINNKTFKYGTSEVEELGINVSPTKTTTYSLVCIGKNAQLAPVTAQTTLTVAEKTTAGANGSLMGVMYLQANSAGTLTNGTTPYRSEKLDLARKPFNGIECPAGFERVGLGLRIEDAGAKNYLAYTCVRANTEKNFDSAPKGTLMGIIYIPSDEKGNLANGTNALTNMKLDAASYPFTGINCPAGSERIGIGLRKEDNGSKNYQVFTCVKTTGSTDYSKVEEGTMMGIVYFQANEKGVHTNGTTPFSNTKLDAVRYPFNGIECPTGFQRMGIGLRMETNATQNFQVGTCVKASNSNLGAIPANQGGTTANTASNGGSTTYVDTSSAQSAQTETVYIPASELRSENAQINFPNGMYISIPGGLNAQERAYQIDHYTNENYHFQ